MAQTWFEPHLYNNNNPEPFTTDWDLFREELELNFGEPDSESNAEFRIRRLRMQDSHRCARYTVEFNTFANQINWDDRALAAAYYEGLADRIKDRLTDRPGGKPKRFPELRRIAQEIDSRHWQREEEKSRSRSHSDKDKSSSQKPVQTNSPRNNTSDSSRSTSEKSSDKSKSKSTTPASNKPDLTGKLTTDNKLTPEERKHRIDNDLCLYCSKKGHKASDCRLATANKKARDETKGRAATISATDPEVVPTQSEN
jgi:hypothetical protein